MSQFKGDLESTRFLGISKKMLKLSIAVALCAFASLACAKAPAALSYGMTMGTRAYDAVCWYENLKNFPDTNSQNYGQCSEAASNVQNQIENPSEQNQKYFDFYPDKQVSMYGDWMTSLAMNRIPADYQATCGKFLKDPNAAAPANEADTLNDGNTGSYPYKAFAYCLMKQLRDKKGAKAIDAVKNERTQKLKHWQTTLLDRENEFRARHGSEAFQLVKQLNDEAQKWAEVNARECNMYHSKNSDPGRQYQGQGTGESLSASGGSKNISQIAAYLAADGWYEEIKDYPFPGSYQGNGADPLFPRIGHFTQSVWKGSKYVGYGYAFNPNCKSYTGYVAARYWPAGNMIGQFDKNVFPPK